MVWYAWVMIGVYVCGALTTAYYIGKQRKPYGFGVAIASWITQALFIWAIITLAT